MADGSGCEVLYRAQFEKDPRAYFSRSSTTKEKDFVSLSKRVCEAFPFFLEQVFT